MVIWPGLQAVIVKGEADRRSVSSARPIGSAYEGLATTTDLLLEGTARRLPLSGCQSGPQAL